jgi:hypothetical protein
MDRLKKVLTGAADIDYQEFLDRLFDELASFGAVDPPRDDCTAIVLDLHGHTS